MKVLVVGKPNVKGLFNWPSEHDIIFSSPEEALITYSIEKPSMVLVFAEHESNLHQEANEALADIKLSAPSEVKIYRLGFLKPKDNSGEKYLRLPLKLSDDFLSTL